MKPYFLGIIEINVVPLARNSNKTYITMIVGNEIMSYEKDSFQSWIVLSVCFSSFVVIGAITTPTFTILVPEIDEYFDFDTGDNEKVMDIAILQNGTMLLLAPLGCWLISKFGFHATCIIGCFIAAISILFSTVSPTLVRMMILYGFISGIGLSMLETKVIISCDLSFQKNRIIASSISRSGQYVGFVVFSYTYDIIKVEYGWKVCLYISTALLLLVLIIEVLLTVFEYSISKSERLSKAKEGDDFNEPLLTRHLTGNSMHYSEQDEHTSGNTGVIPDIAETYSVNTEEVDANNSTGIESVSSPTTFQQLREITAYHYCFLFGNNGCVIWILAAKFFGEGSLSTHSYILNNFLQSKGIAKGVSQMMIMMENGLALLSCVICGLIIHYNKNSKQITPINISSVGLLITGSVYFVMVFTSDSDALTALCVISGLAKSTFLLFNSVLWFDIVPEESYVLAIAYTQVFQGLGCVTFPFIIDAIFLISKNAEVGVLVESVTAVICGLFLASGSYIAQVMNST